MSISVDKRNGDIVSIHLFGDEARCLASILKDLQLGFHGVLKVRLEGDEESKKVVALIAKEV